MGWAEATVIYLVVAVEFACLSTVASQLSVNQP